MKSRSILPILIISVLVFFIVLLIRIIPAIRTMEFKTIDWRFQFRGPISVKDQPIVLVTIDDQSFESLPDRWPWPRYYYARVIENLTRAGAKVIGLDIILDVEDKHGKISDQQLADAIRQSGKVVLAGKLEERTSLGQIQSYQFPVMPIPVLLKADSIWGITAIQADPDGVYRRYYVIQNYQKGFLSSFGLQILRKYFNYGKNLQPAIQDHQVRFGKLEIPLFDDGLMMINFAGPAGSFTSYSFDSVIDDERFNLNEDYDLDYFSTTLLPEGVFKDKIVLIGATVSELKDNFLAPFFEFKDREGNIREVKMSGVEVHANAIWTILNRLYFNQIPLPVYFVLLFLLIFAAVFLVQRFSVLWSVGIIITLIILFNLLQFFLFSQIRLVIEMVSPTIALVLSFFASNVYQYIQSQKEKMVIVGAFERYVPQRVVKELLADPSKLTLGGEERFLTVMFVDLADFTVVSERLKPAKLVSLINTYLTEMTEVILEYNGIIDKYEGDAIMAEFGAPVFYEEHAIHACYAALEMQRRIKRLDLSNFKNVVDELSCRIGINSGNMIVGNMGSRNVFDYTVMGDAVNLAARLEGANKTYRTKIMISYETYSLAKDHVIARPLDLIRVKGRQKPVRVFELVARKDEKIPDTLKTMLPIFVNGIRYYHQRNWSKALECFHYCLKLVPGDVPSKIYIERVLHYSKYPPEENWDGVYSLKYK